MNSRPIPEFTVAQITESIVHFMEKNPDGGLCDHLVFAVQSDALLSGHKPPTDLEIRAVANHLSQYKVQDALIHVTQIGCGLAGFTPDKIAPMFRRAPSNRQFSSAWAEWLPNRQYWTDK